MWEDRSSERINEGQDSTEGNVFSLLQHNCYESASHWYTYMTYIGLFVFSVMVGAEGEREYGTQSFKNEC